MTTRVNNIEAALSLPRLRRFIHPCGGSRSRALRLYRWNAQVASAYWTPLHFLEVAVRNAVHDAMAEATGDEWWFAEDEAGRAVGEISLPVNTSIAAVARLAFLCQFLPAAVDRGPRSAVRKAPRRKEVAEPPRERHPYTASSSR